MADPLSSFRATKGTDWVNGEKAVSLLFKSIELSKG